jgi:hypothetical protein
MCTTEIHSVLVYLPFSWERKSFRIDVHVVTTGSMSTFSVINTNSRSINNSTDLDAKKGLKKYNQSAPRSIARTVISTTKSELGGRIG